MDLLTSATAMGWSPILSRNSIGPVSMSPTGNRMTRRGDYVAEQLAQRKLKLSIAVEIAVQLAQVLTVTAGKNPDRQGRRSSCCGICWAPTPTYSPTSTDGGHPRM